LTGKFYGLGVGPGDPELITIKAINIANRVDILIAPETASGKGSIAYDIIKGHLVDERKIRFQTYPMTYDANKLDSTWNENVKEIMDFLKQGKDVAFITLGDPMIYSTYIYIMGLIKKMGMEVQTVPGITSFCAAASRLNLPLAEGDETVAIIPAAYDCENLDEIINTCDNIVLMKPSKGFEKIVEKLENFQLADKTVMIQKCGHGDEKIYHDLREVEKDKVPYLSMLITKKRGE